MQTALAQSGEQAQIRRSRKASNSISPLSKPTTAIHTLVAQFQEYLHFPDPTPLYALLGSVAANMMTGKPVWLMMVGPPGCGKTALLNSLSLIPRTEQVGTLSGEAALLSGTSAKDKAKDATGGLLRRVGLKGSIIINEFTGILAIQYEQLVKVMAAFRQIYDGEWSREVGTDGARVLKWGPNGKLGLLAGCTESIDDHHGVASEMGERWIMYRYPDTDGYQESKAAVNQTRPKEALVDIQEAVRDFFTGIGLEWGLDGDPITERRQLTLGESRRVIAVATLAALCRSAVVRDNRTREVVRVPQAERGTRLAAVFGNLYCGMETIGLEEGERWRVVRRVALDCMPQVRRRVMETLIRLDRKHGERGVSIARPPALSMEDMQAGMKCSVTNTRRIVEDLTLHGVLVRDKARNVWGVSDMAWELIREGWN
jgi:hypothetical protein